MSQNRENEKLVQQFLNEEKGEFSEIRTVLIFGRNSSTYKFAFCHALLQQNAVNSLKYQEIKGPMLDIFIERYKAEKKQFQAGDNNLTRSIDKFLISEISREQFEAEADKVIFNNVLDAFQNVGGSTLDKKHMLFEHDKKSKQIVLTDRLNLLLENPENRIELLKECENRWSVVEQAWESNLSANLVYDAGSGTFFKDENPKRVAVRSALNALLPYQKGRCFYCSTQLDVTLSKDKMRFPDVDHFIPFSFFRIIRDFNPNGVWNLVVSCMNCNRGPKGKFDQVPDIEFYEKLLKRNLYFSIEHKHALKTSVLMSLGASNSEGIRSQMSKLYYQLPVKKWRPYLKDES